MKKCISSQAGEISVYNQIQKYPASICNWSPEISEELNVSCWSGGKSCQAAKPEYTGGSIIIQMLIARVSTQNTYIIHDAKVHHCIMLTFIVR